MVLRVSKQALSLYTPVINCSEKINSEINVLAHLSTGIVLFTDTSLINSRAFTQFRVIFNAISSLKAKALPSRL